MKTISTKEFACGVYLKPSGKLALVYVDGESGKKRWYVDVGKTKNHPIFRIKIPMVFESNSPQLGWGPTKFLNNCEYLGEL